jgi:hypothetical protein
MKIIKVVSLFILLILFSRLSMGIGTNPNPTGGFGNTNSGTSVKVNTNPTGGFGNVPHTLGTPPPPPPVPTPLDPGVIILIVACLALGFKKLYHRIHLNDVAAGN